MASPLQLASSSWQYRLKATNQQTRHNREQPLEAPQLARDYGSYNIRVNAIAPGWIMTQRQIEKWLTPEGVEELMRRQCLKRKLIRDEIAKFAVFLASDKASACTAQHYVVDGGWV